MSLDAAKRGALEVTRPPLKAITAASDSYEEGYHKGNVGGLDAIDTDLAPGNIKQGITIFGKAGTLVPCDVSDADAAVGDVRSGKTFYAGTCTRKTGTWSPTGSMTQQLCDTDYSDVTQANVWEDIAGQSVTVPADAAMVGVAIFTVASAGGAPYVRALYNGVQKCQSYNGTGACWTGNGTGGAHILKTQKKHNATGYGCCHYAYFAYCKCT